MVITKNINKIFKDKLDFIDKNYDANECRYYMVDYTILHTRELLGLYKQIRLKIYMEVRYLSDATSVNSTCRKLVGLKKKMKEELSTREHIPNKIEAKKIRQQKMHNKKHR